MRAGLQLLPHGLALAAFMCAAFAAVAGAFVAAALPLTGIHEDPPFYVKLGVKVVLFAALAAAAWVMLSRLMRTFPPRLKAPPAVPSTDSAALPMAGLLCVFAALLLPRLGSYPWTAPDELHHLSVVRNLAEHGQYASGHPDGETVRFDSYDSVGPAVLVPVAAVSSLFDGGLAGARAVMAVFFLLWLGASWLLLRPVLGDTAALIGVALGGTAIGSIYLGRTVYGEVPALLYTTAGLIYWRLALGRIAHQPWSILAGLCFGLAVLSKSFLILTVFPIAAVYAFDRLSFRRIPVSRIVWPAMAAAAVLGGWTLFKSFAGADSEDTETLHLYRHYLLFGFTSVGATAGWLVQHWLAVAVVAAGFLASLPTLLLVRYDPPTLTLSLTAVLLGFWWTFFTPGQIPRYLWYTLAIGGMMAGPLLLAGARSMANRAQPRARRLGALLVCGIVLAPPTVEVQHVVRQTWTGAQMADEYALEDFLAAHADDPVVTTSWMAQRSANYFADRYVPRIAPDSLEDVAAIVIRDRALEDFSAEGLQRIGEGRYWAVMPGDTHGKRNE